MKNSSLKKKSIMKLKNNALSTEQATQANGGGTWAFHWLGASIGHRNQYSPPPRWDSEGLHSY